MERFTYKLVLAWMVATTAHLPVPVWDGDHVTANGRPCAADCFCLEWFDVDFMLLGCDEADDLDDGPFDDDPDDEDPLSGPFPVYLQITSPSSLRAGTVTSSLAVALRWHPRGRLIDVHRTAPAAAASAMLTTGPPAGIGAGIVMQC